MKHSFNPHFTRMRSEMQLQYADLTGADLVSILILQGCALKFTWTDGRISLNMCFNPHFTRMRSEILDAALARVPTLGFNPHFTRMRSEIQVLVCLLHLAHGFQSSFYKDALWNGPDSSHSARVQLGFNPHFTRMRSEMVYSDTCTGINIGVSILILQGCALK